MRDTKLCSVFVLAQSNTGYNYCHYFNNFEEEKISSYVSPIASKVIQQAQAYSPFPWSAAPWIAYVSLLDSALAKKTYTEPLIVFEKYENEAFVRNKILKMHCCITTEMCNFVIYIFCIVWNTSKIELYNKQYVGQPVIIPDGDSPTSLRYRRLGASRSFLPCSKAWSTSLIWLAEGRARTVIINTHTPTQPRTRAYANGRQTQPVPLLKYSFKQRSYIDIETLQIHWLPFQQDKKPTNATTRIPQSENKTYNEGISITAHGNLS